MAVPLLHNRTGAVFGPGRSYAVGTVALLVLAAISIASWPLLPTIERSSHSRAGHSGSLGYGQRQRVAASLNANTIGVVALEPHWQRISFHAPALVWNYGLNILTLNFSYASLERQSGRRLSVGIDRVSVD